MVNQIRFGVGFNVDKSGLDQVTKQLKEIQTLSKDDLIKINGDLGTSEATEKIQKAKKAAQDLELALIKAYNPRLNMVDMQAFNDSLNKAGTNASKLQQDLSGVGSVGQNAFNNLRTSLTSLNQNFKTTETLVDKIGKTLMNTIRWNLSSSIVNQMSTSVQEAYGYVKHLDSALNDIRIVTGKSAEEMDTFAQKANTAAQALGKSTNDYTEAALIYAQQGEVQI